METVTYLQTGAGLAIVLGLIVLVAFIARKAGLGTAHVRREQRRLSIVEAMTLDPKRRVLLIKCDNAEHLVLLGPNSETVLGGRAPEREIHQSATSNLPAVIIPPADPKAEAAARAAAFAARGATVLKPLGGKPETWTSGTKPSANPRGRREPIIGPAPREPK